LLLLLLETLCFERFPFFNFGLILSFLP